MQPFNVNEMNITTIGLERSQFPNVTEMEISHYHIVTER